MKLYKAGLYLSSGYTYRPCEADSGSSSTTDVCIMNRSDLERGYGSFSMEALVACVFFVSRRLRIAPCWLAAVISCRSAQQRVTYTRMATFSVSEVNCELLE